MYALYRLLGIVTWPNTPLVRSRIAPDLAANPQVGRLPPARGGRWRAREARNWSVNNGLETAPNSGIRPVLLAMVAAPGRRLDPGARPKRACPKGNIVPVLLTPVPAPVWRRRGLQEREGGRVELTVCVNDQGDVTSAGWSGRRVRLAGPGQHAWASSPGPGRRYSARLRGPGWLPRYAATVSRTTGFCPTLSSVHCGRKWTTDRNAFMLAGASGAAGRLEWKRGASCCGSFGAWRAASP